MKFLIVLNDPPYGTERSYNGLRLAGNLVTKHEDAQVDVFLMGDAVWLATEPLTSEDWRLLPRRSLHVFAMGRRVADGSSTEEH